MPFDLASLPELAHDYRSVQGLRDLFERLDTALSHSIQNADQKEVHA